MQKDQYNFDINDINKCVQNAEYAVRGRVPIRAQEIQKTIDEAKASGKPHGFPFEELTEANIGNPQTFGQPPISFFRNVLSCTLNPSLIDDGLVKNQDVINRVRHFQKYIKGNIGAYTHSLGYEFVRKSIAEYIARRDNAPVEKDLTNYMTLDGASQGVHLIFQAFVSHCSDGIMIPIPQYPLYSAVISLYGGQQVPYFLNEEKGWQISIDDLEQSYQEAFDRGVKPKILVVINPGNPTGKVLSRESIEDLIKFASEKKMIIIADEVYQTNVYNEQVQFNSFKKVLKELEAPYNLCELFSVHSTSKGILGECGLRGGYLEMVNISPEIKAQMLKLKSINLCSNTVGQITTELMCNPPSAENGCSEETIRQYQIECQDLFNGLKERMEVVNNTLNGMVNIQAQLSDGSMYAFPRVLLSENVKKAAKKQGMKPDLYYCLQVLENTGLVIVPGSGFSQKPGTYHFRITNLIRPKEKLEKTLKAFIEYNEKFHSEHE